MTPHRDVRRLRRGQAAAEVIWTTHPSSETDGGSFCAKCRNDEPDDTLCDRIRDERLERRT